MPEQPAIVDICGVSKTFRVGGSELQALRDTSLRVRPGEFICLIGASGCGKSTLLRLVGGFDAPSAGSVTMWGTPVTGPGPERGMVFQDYALFPWLTVRGNVAFGPRARGLSRKHVEEATEHFLEMVGLAKFADAYPHQLSGGMKQRVAIARVLANDAEVILMDEPFGALDAMTRERLQEELLQLWQRTKRTVIFVTHAIEEAILLADRVVVMATGPGRIQSENRIALARPRDVASPEFNAIRRELSQHLSKLPGVQQTAERRYLRALG